MSPVEGQHEKEQEKLKAIVASEIVVAKVTKANSI